MSLQEQIKKDLMAAMKARDEEAKATLRVILGELARLDQKVVPDDAVIKTVRFLCKCDKKIRLLISEPAGHQ